MILDTIFAGIIGFITEVISLMPSLPATPEAIKQAAEGTINGLHSSVGVATLVMHPVIISGLFVLSLAMMNFQYAYMLMMWAIRKLPFLGIK